MAWWIPASSRPGTASSRRAMAPTAITTASYRRRRSAALRSVPTATPVRKRVPSARICSSRRSSWCFSSLNSGIPYRRRPPGRSSRSYTVTACPARELLGAGQPGRAGADDGDGLARRLLRGPRGDVTAFPGPVGDGGLDVLDRHRGLADGHHAGGLARGRAEPAGELGEVVGGVQPLARARPVVAPDEIVPFRDEVPQRAAVVAERDAAVHAASGL